MNTDDAPLSAKQRIELLAQGEPIICNALAMYRRQASEMTYEQVLEIMVILLTEQNQGLKKEFSEFVARSPIPCGFDKVQLRSLGILRSIDAR